MLQKIREPKSCLELIQKINNVNPKLRSEKIIFSGVGIKDVYNISAPFEDEGELVIAGRVEARSELISDIVFFVYRDGVWTPREKTISFKLQDPFYTWIGNELVFGGVEVYTDAHHNITSWRTLFYRGVCINDLKLFATGPLNMKDIRLVEITSGRIGILTRPHGLPDARAKIGYIEIQSLDELSEEVIASAHLFSDQFLKDEWGGANEAILLKNGLIGVLGHISYKDGNENLHYHSMTFALNPNTMEKTSIMIIATRNNFLEGPAKEDRLYDVIFSGGIVRLRDGLAYLYAGVSDAEAHRLLITDPFLEYEVL